MLYTIYGAVLLSLPISRMIVRIRIFYLIVTVKSELWPICHCSWLGHETMVCAACIFYILRRLWYIESISNKNTTVLHQAFQEMSVLANHGLSQDFN